MTSKISICIAALAVAAPLTGCSLLKVNGKPLFGGKKADAAGTDASGGDAPASGAGGGPSGGGGDDQVTAANTGELEQVIDEGNAANDALFEAFKNDQVPADALASLESAAKKTAELGDPKSAAFYELRVHTYRFIAAMQALDGGDEGPIAELMQGKVEKEGVSGKDLEVSVKLKADHCYKVALKWKSPTGTEDLRGYDWTASKPQAIQRFRLSVVHPYLPWSFGMCATEDTQAKFTAEFNASGSKPRLQYAVVSWPRDEVPGSEMLHASVVPPDKCSAKAWKSLWLDPIPGSIVYGADEPLLLSGVSTNGGSATLLNATGTQGARPLTSLKGSPKASARVAVQFSMPRCLGSESAASSLSKKAAKCHEAIDRKYDRKFEYAEAVRDNAPTIGALRSAEAKLSRLREAEGNERRSKCGGVDNKLEADVERAFNEIVDAFADGATPKSDQRMKRLHLL